MFPDTSRRWIHLTNHAVIAEATPYYQCFAVRDVNLRSTNPEDDWAAIMDSPSEPRARHGKKIMAQTQLGEVSHHSRVYSGGHLQAPSAPTVLLSPASVSERSSTCASSASSGRPLWTILLTART
jgi:hypothetical protein